MLRMMKMVPGGGKATQPVVTTFYLKGNRMASESPENIHLIDLDKETITDINLKDKTFATITFAEMKAAMEAALQRTRQQPQTRDAQIDFKVSVKETGAAKRLSGLDTKQFLLTLAWQVTDAKSGQKADMSMDNDMWMAAELPGYDEVRKFTLRMAEKISWMPGGAMSSMAGMQPGMQDGMAKLAKETQKLQGIPVQQITRMMISGEGSGMAGAPDVPMPGLKDVAGSAVGGMLGGFGRKKKAEPAPAEPKATEKKQGENVFMEVTATTSDWSSGPVDSAKLSVPAGFKEVQHEMKKLLK
jgi:hypothetical protein